ncbi:MAG: ABC transporter permease DevC [Planctomycetota bacterium]
MKIPIAWLQLQKDRWRLVIAVGGVAFAVILVFMQLGFRDALFTSAVRMHTRFKYDLAMISPRTPTLIYTAGISRQRVAQARGFEGVLSAESVNLGYARWKNPTKPEIRRGIYMIGFDPSTDVIDIPGFDRYRGELQKADVCLYDRSSRKEFGPIADLVQENGSYDVELADRKLHVAGLFELGTSFGIDANILVSDLNYYRYNPEVPRRSVQLGLIRIEPDTDVLEVRERLTASLPSDVLLLTRDEFMQREVDYWDSATPIGFVFGLGSLVGLIVGAIIVYQILFADVTDHMKEYATLKAMGYSNSKLSGIVLRQAMLLATFGFVPAVGIAMLLYRTAGAATKLPMEMTLPRAAAVYGLTLLICVLSATIAQRKVRKADPAELF